MSLKWLLASLTLGSFVAILTNAWVVHLIPISQAAAPAPPANENPFASGISLSTQDLDKILVRNIFGFETEEMTPVIEDIFANLPLRLIGTIAALGQGIAVLENTTGTPTTNSFQPGETVLPGMTLESVYPGKVTLLRDGKRIALLMEKDPPIPKRQRRPAQFPPKESTAPPMQTAGFQKKGDDIQVSRDYVEHVLSDMPTVLTSMKAMPHVVDGQFQGFMISAIKENSIAQRLGLQDGDLVTAINDTELVGVAASVQQLRALKSANSASFKILRGDEEKTLTIDVR